MRRWVRWVELKGDPTFLKVERFVVVEQGEDVEASGGFDELGEVIEEGEIVQ